MSVIYNLRIKDLLVELELLAEEHGLDSNVIIKDDKIEIYKNGQLIDEFEVLII